MELHWSCCECDANNTSPDDEHLVCSGERCDHHLCSDCYNPQQIGREVHLNALVATTRQSVSKSLVNDAAYEEHRRKKSKSQMFRNARKLIGHHMKHSRLGMAFLNFWSYVQRKTGKKKDKLRITGSKTEYLPALGIPMRASNTESLPSTSQICQSEEITEYRQEAYYYE
ncbi:unnamed protein product [Calypogeia fissa]